MMIAAAWLLARTLLGALWIAWVSFDLVVAIYILAQPVRGISL